MSQEVIPKHKCYSYYYFSKPVKENYIIGDKRKPVLKCKMDNYDVLLYFDKNDWLEMIRIDIDKPDKDSDLIAQLTRRYVESILRLTYASDFKISPVVFKFLVKYAEGKPKPKIKQGIIKYRWNDKKPTFDRTTFLGFASHFAQKSLQVELFTDSLGTTGSPIIRYLNLYKIIEFEYHLSDDRGRTKEILKKSGFKEIIKQFEYNGKREDDLIDYIVDLRGECSHLKKSSGRGKYGFSESIINDCRKLNKFIPTMKKNMHENN